MEPSVRLVPLGGLGEIGLNMMLIESGDELIAVISGLMFPDDEMPGIDDVDAAGRVVAGPEIGSRGVVYVKESEPLLEELRAAVGAALAERGPVTPVDREALGTLVRTAVRVFITQRFQRKPVVLPLITET